MKRFILMAFSLVALSGFVRTASAEEYRYATGTPGFEVGYNFYASSDVGERYACGYFEYLDVTLYMYGISVTSYRASSTFVASSYSPDGEYTGTLLSDGSCVNTYPSNGSSEVPYTDLPTQYAQ